MVNLVHCLKTWLKNIFVFELQLEFVDSVGSNTLAGVFVLLMESVHSKYRNFCSVSVGLAFTIGEVFLGIIAAYVHNFRQLIRILYAPGILSIAYLWLYPESIRWLLVTGRTGHAIKVLQRRATVNRRELSASSIEYIQQRYPIKSTPTTGTENDNNAP